MIKTRYTLTVITALAGIAIGACDHEPSAEETALRSLTISDQWDLFEPTELPDIDTCEKYWSERCEELTPAQCQLAKNRYKCSEAEHGVIIEDGYWLDATDVTWLAVDKTGAIGIEGMEDPFTACEGLEDYDRCKQLATVAAQLSAHVPVLMQSSPNGGIGRITLDEKGAAISTDFDLKVSEDMMLVCMSAFDWSVPTLAEAHLGDEFHIIEDEIMLMVRPNGTISVSTDSLTLVQDQAVEEIGACDIDDPPTG